MTAIADGSDPTISDRLRSAWGSFVDDEFDLGDMGQLVHDAADEIERLRERVADETMAAQGMSADLSRFVDDVCGALCKHGGWDEIDGDGSPESIIEERIRNIADHDAPRWWDE